MGDRLRQSVDGFCLARRVDRRDERFLGAARRSPVGRDLRRGRGHALRELVGDPGVQVLALAGEDRRVDRLRQERVAETEAVRRLFGDEDAVLDGLPQRFAHFMLSEVRDRAEERVADVASDG